VPRGAGVNRTLWDLRYDGATGGGGGRGAQGRATPPGTVGAAGATQAEAPAEEGAGRGGRGGGGGPFVLPGDYTITLRAGGREQTTTVTVDTDPRVTTTAADLQAQLDAALALRDLTTRANTAVERANTLVTQLTALQDRLRRAPARITTSPSADGDSDATGPSSQSQAPGRDLAAAVDAALKAVQALRDDDLTRPYPNMGYRQYPRIREEINSLSGSVSRGFARPTEGQALRAKELNQELDRAIAALNKIQTEQIGKINDMMKTMPFIVTEPIR